MPATMSVFRHLVAVRSYRRALGQAFVLAAGLVWIAVMLVAIFNTEPGDDAARCRRSVFRDPVTGRDEGIGSSRVAPDGAAICHGVAYPANP